VPLRTAPGRMASQLVEIRTALGLEESQLAGMRTDLELEESQVVEVRSRTALGLEELQVVEIRTDLGLEEWQVARPRTALGRVASQVVPQTSEAVSPGARSLQTVTARQTATAPRRRALCRTGSSLLQNFQTARQAELVAAIP